MFLHCASHATGLTYNPQNLPARWVFIVSRLQINREAEEQSTQDWLFFPPVKRPERFVVG